MNLLDIVIIVIVGSSFVLSLFRGAIKEVFSIGSVIVGFLIANHTYWYMAGLLMPFVHHEPLSTVIGYAVVFVGCSMGVRLIGVFIEKVVRQIMLGWADHLLGAVFGFIKGCLIVSVIVMLMTTLMPGNKVFQESRLAPYIISTVDLMAKVFPEDIKKCYQDARARTERAWEGGKVSSMLSKEQDKVMDKLIKKEKK